MPTAQRGGADGGGEVQGEWPVLREAGADGTAERPAGRGAAAGRALAHARHGEQPGAERGRGRDRRARRGLGGLMGLLGWLRRAGVRETAGATGAAVWVVGAVLRVVGAMVWVAGAVL